MTTFLNIISIKPTILAALLFGLAATFRYALNLGLIDRPLTIGFIWGFISNDWYDSLAIAIFFELFWLDTVILGTYLPPLAILSLLIVFSLKASLGLSGGAATLILPVLFTIPAAYLGSKAEQWRRKKQEKLYSRLAEQGEALQGQGLYFHTFLYSLLKLFSLQIIIFYLSFLTVFALLNVFASILKDFGVPSPLYLASATWSLLWMLGAVGGILSLRTSKAMFTFVLASGICVFWFLATN